MPAFNQEFYDYYCQVAFHDESGRPNHLSTQPEKVAELKRIFEWQASFDGVAPSKIPPLNKFNKPKKPHRFITISLPKDIASKDIDYQWKMFMKKHQYTEKIHSWTYEFIGSDNQYHPHIHVLMETTAPQKGTIIRDIATKFKIDKNYIDVRTDSRPEMWEKRILYIRGDKSTHKQAQVDADNEIRALNDLKTFYTNNT